MAGDRDWRRARPSGWFSHQAADIWRDRSRSRATRQDAAVELKRATLIEFCDAAKIYRAALADEANLSSRGELPSNQQRVSLSTSRMDHQALLYRVDPDITSEFKNWEKGATSWANGDASVAQENSLWDTCMESSGRRLRELDAV